ncbi:hypothetical protein INR77_07810 [Erythrobacter sp. SCSIO 43205]|uniref:hypothetical protein n=1 Tax=Erythrobacter sp. SCSIO 43205 TaxID=2779361 RepID=UPI001CA8972A|nr:hypothetical protein [Erythrobacter sp. SCSIO 43205]UAB79548.1 hypothetical protein INR77_07810 [Erythrobacter sp. SCSIO 43205]
MTAPPQDLLKAAAFTLNAMAAQVEEFGAELVTDPDFAQRHLTSLQSLDRWSQELVQLAKVIAADDPVAAAEAVTLSELRDHLRAAKAA